METLEIEGVIGWDVTSRSFKRALRELGDVDELAVNINSPGGYIDEGLGIYTALKNHSANVTVHITGMAASMASVIAMAGDSITIEETGMFMIHPPANIVWGTAVDMRKEADVLDKYQARITKAYQRRELSMSDAELDAAIADETWYTAEEVVQAGFVDSIADGAGSDSEGVGESTDPFDSAVQWLRVAAYKNMPDALRNQVSRKNTKKELELSSKLLSPPVSSADEPTKGKSMSTYTQAEFDDAVQAAADAARNEVKNDSDALHERYSALMAHPKAHNTKAVARLAKSSMPIEDALAVMDDMAELATAEPENKGGLSDEEANRIAAEAAASAVAKARAEASGTSNLEDGDGEEELVDKAAAMAAKMNKERGAE